MPLIYCIEDDAALIQELERLLDLQGFRTAHAGSFTDVAAAALEADPDCIVLDLKLPNQDGLQILREIRGSSQVPVIMLTSSESEFDEVMALGLGADDYIVKPYRPATLIARIEGALRRSCAMPEVTVSHGGVTLDMTKGEVSANGKTAELSRNELRILDILMRNAGNVVSRQQLMAHLWESDEFIDDNTLTVNVNRLRSSLSKLGVDGGFVKTRRGIGYAV
ncbi:MAG: response regulator transcription factor [Eggerthellaceae bacterium]|nr:response regulator transcription factor [Eggerthellaceae bacterium]